MSPHCHPFPHRHPVPLSRDLPQFPLGFVARGADLGKFGLSQYPDEDEVCWPLSTLTLNLTPSPAYQPHKPAPRLLTAAVTLTRIEVLLPPCTALEMVDHRIDQDVVIVVLRPTIMPVV